MNLAVLSEVHNDYLADVIVRGNVPTEEVKREFEAVEAIIGDPKWEFEFELAGHEFTYWAERRFLLKEVLDA